VDASRPISPGSPTDRPRLVAVWEAAVRQTHHFLSEEDLAFFRPLVGDAFEGPLEVACVRNEEGTVLGFAGVAEGKLEMLFVDPACHGQGIGRELLAHAVARMGARVVDVNEQNEGAVAFYRRIGAETIGRSERDEMGKPFPLLHLRLPAAAPLAGGAPGGEVPLEGRA
jgi:putative acetyltransferase